MPLAVRATSEVCQKPFGGRCYPVSCKGLLGRSARKTGHRRTGPPRKPPLLTNDAMRVHARRRSRPAKGQLEKTWEKAQVPPGRSPPQDRLARARGPKLYEPELATTENPRCEAGTSNPRRRAEREAARAKQPQAWEHRGQCQEARREARPVRPTCPACQKPNGRRYSPVRCKALLGRTPTHPRAASRSRRTSGGARPLCRL